MIGNREATQMLKMSTLAGAIFFSLLFCAHCRGSKAKMVIAEDHTQLPGAETELLDTKFADGSSQDIDTTDYIDFSGEPENITPVD